MLLVNMYIHTAGTSHMGSIMTQIGFNHIFTCFLNSCKSLLSNCFHWETFGIQCSLEGHDEKPPKCLGISVDVAHPAHYNSNDDGVGMGFGLRKTKVFVQTFILLCLIYWWKK